MREQFPETTPAADIAVGCVLTLVFHVIAIVLAFGGAAFSSSSVVVNILTGFLIALGISQIIYMGPAIYYAYRRGRPNIGKGLLIGAAVTLALTAACWAIINPFTSPHIFQ